MPSRLRLCFGRRLRYCSGDGFPSSGDVSTTWAALVLRCSFYEVNIGTIACLVKLEQFSSQLPKVVPGLPARKFARPLKQVGRLFLREGSGCRSHVGARNPGEDARLSIRDATSI
jgi:hypothetical protein